MTVSLPPAPGLLAGGCGSTSGVVYRALSNNLLRQKSVGGALTDETDVLLTAEPKTQH